MSSQQQEQEEQPPLLLGPCNSQYIMQQTQGLLSVKSSYAYGVGGETEGIQGKESQERLATAHVLPSEYAQGQAKENQENQVDARASPSEYAQVDLRKLVTLQGNIIYQAPPSTLSRLVSVENAGLPTSARNLRSRIASLEDTVYAPTVINGQLYFISLDNDATTAKENSSNENSMTQAQLSASESKSVENMSFSFNQLSLLLGQSTLQRLVANYKDAVARGLITPQSAQLPVPGSGMAKKEIESLRTALESVSQTNIHRDILIQHREKETPDGQTGSSKSGSEISQTGSAITSFSQMSANTAASRSMITAAERSASAHTAMSSPSLLTAAEKSATAHTALDEFSTRSSASENVLTAAEKSASAHTAKGDESTTTAASRSMLTAAERSASAHTAYEVNSTMTAASRSMITAAEKSQSARTANSRTILTAASASDLAFTASAPTTSAHTAYGFDIANTSMALTANPIDGDTLTARNINSTVKSTTADTARSIESNLSTGQGEANSTRTAKSASALKIRTAWERKISESDIRTAIETMSDAELHTCVSDVATAIATASQENLAAIASGSMSGVPVKLLTSTPASSDHTATTAQASVENATAEV